MDAPSRHPRVALGAIVVTQVLAMGLWFSASAVGGELALEWGLSPAGEAWLTASVQLGFVAGALASAASNLADRVPAHRVLAVSAALGALATAAIAALRTGAEAAFVLRFVTGMALAGVYPPGMKLAASWSVRRRGTVIGLLVGALVLGSALPHLVRALVPVGSPGGPSWRAVLYTASAAALVAAIVVALWVRPGPHLARSAPFDWRHALSAFRDPPLRLANLGYLGHMWELYAVYTWVPVLLVGAFAEAGASETAARLVGFGTIAIGAGGSLAAGLLADRLGRTTLATASLVVSGSCCLVAGWVTFSPFWLGVLCLVWGFAVVADSAQFSAAVSELCDSRYVGTALAMQTSLGFLLTFVTIHLVPQLELRFGWGPALATLALGPLVGSIAMLRLRARPEAARLAQGRR